MFCDGAALDGYRAGHRAAVFRGAGRQAHAQRGRQVAVDVNRAAAVQIS